MQTIFAAEEVFHSETSKVYTDFEVIADKLAKEVQRGTLPKKVIPKSQGLTLPHSISAATTPTSNSTISGPPKVTNNGITTEKQNSIKDYEAVNSNNNSSSSININGTSPPSTNGTPSGRFAVPEGATTENLPDGVLYRVKASYKYQAEDVDELTFEEGELINVVEYEDPEEQEEGWLMGYKDKDGSKGMFPANFTRPIDNKYIYASTIIHGDKFEKMNNHIIVKKDSKKDEVNCCEKPLRQGKVEAKIYQLVIFFQD
ncbi:AMPH [Lepeophtheirus salmonis]|uniref:AMPH n=1 Tax=Lepeophtheirus salmonis TaxID=72036 RepID=A0A7R8CXS0_LEPSM|nr:AMPH [Lepeophtheirus salmonis]CAF2964682.1 AMPH [Lepeophtheirus salmonis]